MSPFDVTLLVSIAVLGFYALNGLRHFNRTQTFVRFFLDDRNLTQSNVRNTFAGAAVSISTVLSFFLTLGVLFGWQIFWSPLTLVLGVVAFAEYIYPRLKANPRLRDALAGVGDNQIESMGDLVEFLYQSRGLGQLVAAISGVGVVAVLVAEMMVGVTIYNQYFLRPEYIVFIIAGTLFLYAGLGGMRSVVETDRWQVWLISVSLAAIVIVLGIQELRENPRPTPGFSDMLVAGTWTPEIRMPLALFANMFVVNLCFLPSSLRVWQVVVGSSRSTEFRSALWQATALIAFISVASVLISRSMLGRLDHPPQLEEILGFLAGMEGWVSYFVYPLFIIALLSALVSTADSAILPLSQALAARRKTTWTPLTNLVNIFFLLALTVTSYFLVTRVFSLSLVEWILTVFSVTTCIAPTVAIPLLWKQRHFDRFGRAAVGVGAVGGFLVALAWSVTFAGNLTVQPWNCVVGFAVSVFFTALGFVFGTSSPIAPLQQSSCNDEGL